MNVLNTIAICLHEIRVVTIFVHRTLKSMKNYQSSKTSIQDKLSHEISFVEAFLDIYFKGNDPLFQQAEVRENLRQDVMRILQGLRRTLSEYKDDAIQQKVILNEDLIAPHTDNILEASPARPQQSFTDYVATKIDEKMKSVRNRTSPKIDWALYSEKRIESLLAEYRNWTLLLREDLALLGTLGIRPGPNVTNVANLKLQRWFEKQRQASREPAADFVSLTGQLTNTTASTAQHRVFRADYTDQFAMLQERVLVEVKLYSDQLIALTDAEDSDDDETIDSLKVPMRQLAWLLYSSPDQWRRQQEQDDNQSAIQLAQLSCMGFIDDPDKHRMLLLYRIPSSFIDDADSLVTLSERLKQRDGNSGRPKKPMLGTRFKIAHSLASVLLGVFASGWMHKNISSRAVLVDKSGYDVFLIGWGIARRAEDATTMQTLDEMLLEPNLYRHPRRFGRPQGPSTYAHDIYSLGVVLLEIGLWETMAAKFATHIENANQSGNSPSGESVKQALVRLCEHDRVRQEMGDAYAGVVKRCLEGDFGVELGDNSPAHLGIAFRDLVIEKLAMGCLL